MSWPLSKCTGFRITPRLNTGELTVLGSRRRVLGMDPERDKILSVFKCSVSEQEANHGWDARSSRPGAGIYGLVERTHAWSVFLETQHRSF